jgi:actin-related protein 9
MPLYKEDHYLTVHPGSEWTLFSFGLQDSLAPPQFKIPTRVYQDSHTKEYKATYKSDFIEINPIKAGKIIDLDGFNYLLTIILQSVISKNPILTINQIPLLLIVPTLTWSRMQIEYITKFVMESLELTAFNIIDLSLASTFGIGSIANSLVVNVGHENVQIVPILGFQTVRFASKYIAGIGGKTIDEQIKKTLPNLTEQQIIDFKSSGIFEVMNDQKTEAFYNNAELKTHPSKPDEEDDDFDVAKIVTEIDSENGKQNQEEKPVAPNNELEKNYFIDSKTNEKIWIGKERFQGTIELIQVIIDAIYKCLSLIPDIEKRQECYDNLILVGSTFKIPGLKQQLVLKLAEKYLVTEFEENTDKSNGINSTIAAYQQAEELNETEASNLPQVPHSIKLAKYPEYFPEWKKPKDLIKSSWNDVYFLGAQIYAKQIFSSNSNHGKDLFVDSDVYEERGPQSIWDASV